MEETFESGSESDSNDEESDQESGNPESSKTTDQGERDDEQDPTAGVGESTPQMDPTNTPSDNTQGGMCSFLLRLSILILFPEVTGLVSTGQDQFTDAIPTRRTRDMTEMFVCICGLRVEDQERVVGSKTALRCGYEGCETSWVCTIFFLPFHRCNTHVVAPVSYGLLQFHMCTEKLAL